MDRNILKENARISFKRKYGESIVVALIMTLFAGGGSYSSSFSSNTGATDPEYSYDFSLDSIDSILSGIPEEFLYTFIAVFISTFAILSLGAIFLAPIFTVGGNRFFLKLRKGVKTGIGEVTGNFKDGNYWNIVKIFFFRSIKVFLWSLLFIIPGIIKSYEYFLVDYILAVRPDLDSKSAFNMSKRLMDGYKGEAFILELSFIGWQLLSIFFTCGILSIVYVNPYIYATLNEFYAFVRAEGIRKGIVTPMDLPDYEVPVQNGFDMNNGFGFNPQAQGFQGQQPYQNGFYNPQGFQNQAPYQNGYNSQNPYGQQDYQQPFNNQPNYQQPQQAPHFSQESNQPVGNVDNLPNETTANENDAKEVDFKPVDEYQESDTMDQNSD